MIHSDLNHVLENVNSGNDVVLAQPVKFNTNQEIIKVFKKGRSWKAEDNLGNLFTVSNLPGIFQANLQCNILSMFDKRKSPQQYTLTL